MFAVKKSSKKAAAFLGKRAREIELARERANFSLFISSPNIAFMIRETVDENNSDCSFIFSKHFNYPFFSPTRRGEDVLRGGGRRRRRVCCVKKEKSRRFIISYKKSQSEHEKCMSLN